MHAETIRIKRKNLQYSNWDKQIQLGKHLQTNAIVCMSLKGNNEFALTHGQITQENGMRDIESQETKEKKRRA